MSAHGAWVHPALRLVDSAPCGARGVVAATPIPEADLERGPPVSIPRELHFNTAYASALLGSLAAGTAPPALPAGGATPPCAGQAGVSCPTADTLAPSQLLAAALAHERSLGSRSQWAPYIATLPQQPPCPWLLPSAEVAAALAALGARASAWAPAVADARAAALEAAQQAAGQLAGSCAACGDVDALVWALAQVASRSLTQGASSGLVPFVDLLNHHADAGAPMLQLDDADRLVMTVVPIRGREAVPLAVGEELCIRYAGGPMAPLQAFLKFGFVSPEWWEEAAAERGARA